MLLDQTIAGRRCTLWVPEGTGPFALSLCCCGSASELLPQLGALSPNRLFVSPEADWEIDFTPWPAPTLQGGRPFADGSVLGGAGKLVSSQSALPGLGYAASVPVPALAQGAVIPPNRQFLAMLGDQTTGTNVEAPLATIKQAMAETLAGWQGSADGQPINIYIGEELLDSVIANSQNRRALRSGGR